MSALIVARAIAHVWHDGSSALPTINLTIHAGHPIGLVGANGAGKSTLLKILAGGVKPTSGTVAVRGRIGYLSQDIRPKPGETVAEAFGVAQVIAALERLAMGDTDDAVYEAIGPNWDASAQATEALAGFGMATLPLNRLLESLSGGELVRVRLASLIRDAPGCLLLDEPSNHLDSEGRRVLHNFLKSWSESSGLLIATHDRALLSQVAEIVELGTHGLTSYGGGYGNYVKQKRTIELAAASDVQAATQRLESVRAKASTAMDRQRQRISQGSRHWASQRERFMNDGRAQATLVRLGKSHAKRLTEAATELAEAKAKLQRTASLHVDLPSAAVREGQLVLRLQAVSANINDEPLWLEPLDATLTGPRRVGVMGVNGAGKSTLLRLIAGLSTPGIALKGHVERGLSDIAYLDQQLAGLNLAQCAAELAREHAPKATESERRGHLGRFLIGSELAQRPLGELSGGEALRAGLALALMGEHPARLLLLDEPSNHLDLPSLTALEAALMSYAGAIMVVSHDAAFLNAVGIDTVWEISEAGLAVSPHDT